MEGAEQQCGKKKLKNAQGLLALGVGDMRKYLKEKGFKGVDKLHREELCEAIRKYRESTPQKMQGLLAYDGSNSCYMDSSIVALFQANRKWLKRKLLSPLKAPRKIPHAKHPKLVALVTNIQAELRVIYKHLFSHSAPAPHMRCTNMRRLFQTFDKEYQKAYNVRIESIDWVRSQQEPRDFYDLLMRVFEIKPDVKMSVNGDMRRAYFNSPYIPAADLKMTSTQPVLFRKYFPIYRDVTKIRYEAADVICFNIERNFMGEKVATPFSFPEKTKLPNDIELSLKSIIVHHGYAPKSGHYTCLVKIDRKWWHYDDIGPEFKEIGSFKDVASWKNGLALKNCTSLIYSKP